MTRCSITNHLEGLFCKHGAPTEMFVDNDTGFHSKVFRDFLSERGVRLHFCCAHIPSSNGIVEWCHRSVKRITVRKQCPIMEAVYWYNVILKDNVSLLTAPANLIHHYRIQLKGINALPPVSQNSLKIVKEMDSDAHFPCWQPVLTFSFAQSIHWFCLFHLLCQYTGSVFFTNHVITLVLSFFTRHVNIPVCSVLLWSNNATTQQCWDYSFYHIIFTNRSTQAGYDTRSISKRSLTGLNSEFSFS